ncbi:MAG: pyruvate kinase alpha/beta domain-containing protein [Clostridia bacterium]|nr:pyruvate kinase alpha/beta domain-containing protein [Clostridia bacterium]
MFTPYTSAEEKKDEEDIVSYKRRITFSLCSSAMFAGAKAIISVSEKGQTPALLSGLRPGCPIYALTANEKTYRQFSLEWGVTPIYIPNVYNLDEITTIGINILKEQGKLKTNDIVIMAGGYDHKTNSKSYLSNQALGILIKI